MLNIMKMYRSSKSLAISLTPLVVFYLLKTEWGHFLEKKVLLIAIFKSTSKPNFLNVNIHAVVVTPKRGMDSMPIEIRLKTHNNRIPYFWLCPIDKKYIATAVIKNEINNNRFLRHVTS